MSRFKQVDLNKIKTISLAGRKSKAQVSLFGHVIKGRSSAPFFNSLPNYLKAAELNEFIHRVAVARRSGFPFHIMLGAHVVKVGLSPILIDLVRSRIVTGISLNSAGLVHDLEVAFAGKTSEDVAAGLKNGTFGMAKETGRMFAGVVELAEKESVGLGEATGRYINEHRARYRDFSILAEAEKRRIPATVHIAIGADIVNQHPTFRAAPAAEASYRDFKILAHLLINTDRGGVVANIGSAVILPEVFLKALTVARNINKHKCNITTANFDMIEQYRPLMNVVTRPTLGGGRGYSFVGHHEIMIPLLAWGLKSFISKVK